MEINDKYLTLENESRYYIVTGGRGSGKSFAINTLLLLLTYESAYIVIGHRVPKHETCEKCSVSVPTLNKIETLVRKHLNIL